MMQVKKMFLSFQKLAEYCRSSPALLSHGGLQVCVLGFKQGLTSKMNIMNIYRNHQNSSSYLLKISETQGYMFVFLKVAISNCYIWISNVNNIKLNSLHIGNEEKLANVLYYVLPHQHPGMLY